MGKDPKDREGRDLKAFTAKGGNPAGEISEGNCATAGLHDTDTWNKVKNISVGDLMLLSGFHERTRPHRKFPALDTPEGASIIKALELHTGMNYTYVEHGEGMDACCTCII